jgi:hypothetical protein
VVQAPTTAFVIVTKMTNDDHRLMALAATLLATMEATQRPQEAHLASLSQARLPIHWRYSRCLERQDIGYR